MTLLLEVIAPVFLVIGAGYAALWRGMFSEEHISGLMRFAQNIAVPCLLFGAVARLDLTQNFDLRLLGSFYTGAFTCFALAVTGAAVLFKRPGPDCVAIGFAATFSNSLLLGLSIMERAYGSGALSGNYMIIAVHSPLIYGLGITVMELTRARGTGLSWAALARKVLVAIFSTSLVLAITLGFIVNLGHIPVPEVVWAGVDMLARAALPAALFGLGGVLYHYRPEGDMKAIAMVVALSLMVHPAITYGLGRALSLPTESLRSAVVTAAMAPGANAYIFANLYGVGKRVAASAVLIGTALSVLTAWFWLSILP